MAELTEGKYDALDEYYTKNSPKVDPAKNGTGFFTKRTAGIILFIVHCLVLFSFYCYTVKTGENNAATTTNYDP